MHGLTHDEIRHTVSKIPGFYLWKDADSKYLGLSDFFLALFNDLKQADILGKTDHDLPWAEFADTAISHDTIVLEGQSWSGVENARLPGMYHDISFQVSKQAIIDANQNVVGVFASAYPLAKLLLKQHDSSTTKLTPREQDCLYYFLQGDTSKKVADRLSLSVRTVEGHLANLKFKFGVRTKSDLISAAIACGLA